MKFRVWDKLWRTVVGLIIMHPILISRSLKRFGKDVAEEYSVTFRDMKEMWRRKHK